MNLAQHSLVFLIRFYQWVLSPIKTALFGPMGRCRFTPTCSQYALEAVRSHGAFSGGCLAVKRLCRCHPWGDCGYDPVPSNENVTYRGDTYPSSFLNRRPDASNHLPRPN